MPIADGWINGMAQSRITRHNKPLAPEAFKRVRKATYHPTSTATTITIGHNAWNRRQDCRQQYEFMVIQCVSADRASNIKGIAHKCMIANALDMAFMSA